MRLNNQQTILLLVVLVFLLLTPLGQGLLGIALVALFWMLTGNLAGHLLRGDDFGVLGNMALGFVGGIFGTIVFALFGLWGIISIPLIGPLIAGVFGAVLFVGLVRLFNKNFAR